MYYAMEWTYGRCRDERGQRLVTYVSVRTRRERAVWVAQACTDYTSQPGYREAVPSDDAELRRTLAREQRTGYAEVERR